MVTRVKVWDLPTRLFHGLLVLLMTASVLSVWVWDNMTWHANCGYALLTLWLFRMAWGLVGGFWSRFRQMLSSASQLVAHLRRPAAWHLPGHNPLGSVSVLVMLSAIGLQILSGMMSDDDAGFSGPLTALVNNDWVSLATRYHANVGKWILLCLVALHLGAIAFHDGYKRAGLVRSMWTGMKTVEGEAQPSNDRWSHRLMALLVCSALAYLVFAGLGWLQGRSFSA